jgi:hypothetical protein
MIKHKCHNQLRHLFWVSAEVWRLKSLRWTSCSTARRAFPPVIYSWLFWFIRFFLACAGGGLAVVYKIENPIAAVQIGASAPLIIKGLAKFRHR